MFKRLALAALAALSFTVASPAFADPVSDFNHFLASATAFTANDASAALADANARNDKPAAQCYAGILAYVQANPVALPSIPVPAGAISAFQTARDAVKDAQAASGKNLVPDELNKACGWLALDVQADVAKTGADAGFKLFGVIKL